MRPAMARVSRAVRARTRQQDPLRAPRHVWRVHTSMGRESAPPALPALIPLSWALCQVGRVHRAPLARFLCLPGLRLLV